MKNKKFSKKTYQCNWGIGGVALLLIIFLLSISCGFNEPNNSTNDETAVPFYIDTSGYTKDKNGDVLIDLTKQEQYHREWIENTKDIDEDTYYGKPDLWGGGPFGVYLWFDKDVQSKNLWYKPYRNLWSPEIGFKLASEREKPAFIDGNTAIMYLIATTSDQMRNTIYIFRVSDNKIGRTKNAWGFGEGGVKVDNWDGKTIPIEEFSKVVVVNEEL